jgi:hypothetical protein
MSHHSDVADSAYVNLLCHTDYVFLPGSNQPVDSALSREKRVVATTSPPDANMLKVRPGAPKINRELPFSGLAYRRSFIP